MGFLHNYGERFGSEKKVPIVRGATLAMKNALQVHQMRTGYLVAVRGATLVMKNETHIHSRFSKC